MNKVNVSPERLEILERIAKFADRFDDSKKYDQELSSRIYFLLQQSISDMRKLNEKEGK